MFSVSVWKQDDSVSCGPLSLFYLVAVLNDESVLLKDKLNLDKTQSHREIRTTILNNIWLITQGQKWRSG